VRCARPETPTSTQNPFKNDPEPRGGPAKMVRVLFGRSRGGAFLRRGDLRGWARYVFLDESRHAGDCLYVRGLRKLSGC
jgi:hypothetical protein